jgi:hypothetical protein
MDEKISKTYKEQNKKVPNIRLSATQSLSARFISGNKSIQTFATKYRLTAIYLRIAALL